MFNITVESESCKGCGLCVWACPKKIMVISDVSNRSGQYVALCQSPEDCIGCKSCGIICPDGAISITKEG